MRNETRLHPELHPVGLNAKRGTSRMCEIPRPNLVPETGIEPVRGRPQRFLSLMKGVPRPSARVRQRISVTNSTPRLFRPVHACPRSWLSIGCQTVRLLN
jgi:hypothetical protein